MVYMFKLVDGRTVLADSVLVHGEQVSAGDVELVVVVEGPADEERAEELAAGLEPGGKFAPLERDPEVAKEPS